MCPRFRVARGDGCYLIDDVPLITMGAFIPQRSLRGQDPEPHALSFARPTRVRSFSRPTLALSPNSRVLALTRSRSLARCLSSPAVALSFSLIPALSRALSLSLNSHALSLALVLVLSRARALSLSLSSPCPKLQSGGVGELVHDFYH